MPSQNGQLISPSPSPQHPGSPETQQTETDGGPTDLFPTAIDALSKHLLHPANLLDAIDDKLLDDVATTTSTTSAEWQREHEFEHGQNEGRHTQASTEVEDEDKNRTLKLSPKEILDLTSSPDSLPLLPPIQTVVGPLASPFPGKLDRFETLREDDHEQARVNSPSESRARIGSDGGLVSPTGPSDAELSSSSLPPTASSTKPRQASSIISRPNLTSRTVSTPPPLIKRKSSFVKGNGFVDHSSTAKEGRTAPSYPELGSSRRTSVPASSGPNLSATTKSATSAVPESIPMPPFSIPTYLQLELSSSRPSPLYIQRSGTSEFPYESSKVKFDRLLNFLLLPPQLEAVLWFGALACLDAWLYTFTILPLRFFKAVAVLGQWWGSVLLKETRDIAQFIYWGSGRMWQRRLGRDAAPAGDASSRRASVADDTDGKPQQSTVGLEDAKSLPQKNSASKSRTSSKPKHRRTKSTPSLLSPSHKADLLKGLVVLFSCLILTRFDASRMYHGIRGQAAIKLYVIYNVLEVCDRLFSALGQDVFECLFSRETLERRPDGRSKILRPFGMFLLALSYNVIHSTALFYQVITLNVAVNSYSNALLTLLLSNQFVEIKSTVFKKFEKENLFQLTCADVVERFQLWLMLLIIAMRNIVEVGGLTLSSASFASSSVLPNATTTGSAGAFRSGSIAPKSFTIFPTWTGQVLGPFLLVLGSEMLVDWLKHAYITKFNNTKPSVYGRFLDVLTKDYYTNAFSDPNLTRRLGLPVLPLSCLFIRASLQTYHMFLASNVPPPLSSSTLDLSASSSSSSPTAHTAALAHIDLLIRQALGRSSFGGSTPAFSSSSLFDSLFSYTTDDATAFLTSAVFFVLAFLVLLALKLVLGMVLLSFSRRRYTAMVVAATPAATNTPGAKPTVSRTSAGGWGLVEMNEEKKIHFYGDDPEGWKAARERAVKERDKVLKAEKAERDGGAQYGGVERYRMVAKRIW